MDSVTEDWPAPGPGTWELDTAHFDPTVSRLVRDMAEEAMEVGLGEGLELGGAPLKTIQARFVNGRMYTRQVPLVGGDKHRPTPPKAVLWAVTRLHPAFRRRARRSIVAIDEKYWLQEYARWEREWKPKLVATNRRLGEVELTSLSDADLAQHLARVWEHLRWSSILHFRLHASDLAPIGRLLVAAEDWGLDPGEAMSTLAGSSPSTSAPSRLLGEIAAELDRCACEPASLDDVRRASGRAAELLDDYLAEFGNRVTTGYDIRNRTLIELPDVVLSSIRHARQGHDEATVAGDMAQTSLLAQLDPADRAECANLIEEARKLYGLRDENGPLTYEWPAGLARHAFLEAAERLMGTGAISDVEHVFDLSVGELRGLLDGASTPSAATIAARSDERMSWPAMLPPPVIGPVAEMPDVDILPGRMPEMMRAILTVTTLIEREERVDDISLRGVGVGSEAYRGIARVVADADEAFERAEPGDIIVTRLTVPTFNSVLAMAGGVVTEGGGLLSHTAVIARELGIPAIIGVAGALTEIPDGAEIELDPVAGTVTVV